MIFVAGILLGLFVGATIGAVIVGAACAGKMSDLQDKLDHHAIAEMAQ